MRPEKSANLRGIPLSGGPASVYQADAPVAPELFNLPVPFSASATAWASSNKFWRPSGARRTARIRSCGAAVDDGADLFHGFAKQERTRVWMSHGDQMTRCPQG
jgi:GMP synthase (glutamine-hydrolysing)